MVPFSMDSNASLYTEIYSKDKLKYTDFIHLELTSVLFDYFLRLKNLI